MRFGFIGTEGGHFYREFLEEVVRAEELGFDSAWLEEHHGVENHYWPSPLMCLAGVATRTSKIVLGTDIIVLPFYHPVHVAEDSVMLDIMSVGRFILGAAIGYKPDEFELYQQALRMRGARFSEALDLIRLLWTRESVTFEGEYYAVREARIEPRPSTPPPIWVGGWGNLSLRRAAGQGDAWIPGPTAGLEKLLDCQATYRGHLIASGKDPDQAPAPLTREVVIADTDAEAIDLAERHLLVNYRDEYGGGWQHPLIGATDATPIDRLGALSTDRFIVGSPETCVRQIQRFADTFGMDHLICRLYFPGMSHEHIMRELELLANEVMPAFE
ncbi:MAG: LLM class flavin-dependent oxidoreductase [SAR202 cluster bacterium]|nr:LLM class flavin-dependent oxidoreductase [SAR202 cluster bacterium]